MPPLVDVDGILDEPVLNLGPRVVKTAVPKAKKKKTKMSKTILLDVIGEPADEDP